MVETGVYRLDPGQTWTAAAASARGATHARRGLPNQDAVVLIPLPDGYAIALADGHGGTRYHNSASGARLASEVGALALANAGRLDEGALPALAEEIVADWRRSVLADAENASSGDGEVWIDTLHDQIISYGTTLIVARLAPDRLTFLQIGDGDILVGLDDGRIVRPLADDTGLVGEQTHSLCETDSFSHFRMATFAADAWGAQAAAVLLATDGVAKSYRDEKAFQHLARMSWQNARELGMVRFRESLPAWLDELTMRGSGDDVTLCLCLREQVRSLLRGDRR
jgi:serine/threonine protein phosphatase PrpC